MRVRAGATSNHVRQNRDRQWRARVRPSSNGRKQAARRIVVAEKISAPRQFCLTHDSCAAPQSEARESGFTTLHDPAKHSVGAFEYADRAAPWPTPAATGRPCGSRNRRRAAWSRHRRRRHHPWRNHPRPHRHHRQFHHRPARHHRPSHRPSLPRLNHPLLRCRRPCRRPCRHLRHRRCHHRLSRRLHRRCR